LKITIRNLTKRYKGGKTALSDVGLDIESGLFGLLGPNGAGKTTLMKILVCLITPSEGSISVGDFDIARDRGAIRKLIGYLPQEFSAFSRLKTWEFLDYSARLAGLNKRSVRSERVDQLLEQVGLYEARDRRANKLSGGMKRRLGIAQTLISEPKVMIVDEPTVGLDPEERLRFRGILADLGKTDMIIILSTHIVGDISSTCNSMAILHEGALAFNGSPEDLIRGASGQVFVANVDDERLEHVKREYPVISTVPSDKGWEVRFVGQRIDGYSCNTVEPNLEDAYIAFMQTHTGVSNILLETEGW